MLKIIEIDHIYLEHFYKFLRGYMGIFTNSIYATKELTSQPNICGLIKNKDILIVKGAKKYHAITIMKKKLCRKIRNYDSWRHYKRHIYRNY